MLCRGSVPWTPSFSAAGSLGLEKSGRSSANQWLFSKRNVPGSVPPPMLISVCTWIRLARGVRSRRAAEGKDVSEPRDIRGVRTGAVQGPAMVDRRSARRQRARLGLGGIEHVAALERGHARIVAGRAMPEHRPAHGAIRWFPLADSLHHRLISAGASGSRERPVFKGVWYYASFSPPVIFPPSRSQR